MSMAPHMLFAGSANCQVSSPSVSLLSYPSNPHVASWPSGFLGSPASSTSTTLPVGASKTYSQRASAPPLGLAPLVTSVCLFGVSALPLSATVPRCGSGGAAVLGLLIHLSSPPAAPCAPVARVVGGGVVPSSPPSVFPQFALTRDGHSGSFVHPGQFCHSGGVGAQW